MCLDQQKTDQNVGSLGSAIEVNGTRLERVLQQLEEQIIRTASFLKDYEDK